jgi:hypothetical protein
MIEDLKKKIMEKIFWEFEDYAWFYYYRIIEDEKYYIYWFTLFIYYV